MKFDPQLKGIANLVEQNRSQLPSDFELIANQAIGDIASGAAPRFLTPRGGRRTISSKLLKAILAEIYSFLCTNDERYASLRKQAKPLSEGVVLTLAGFVSGKFDVSLAAATAAVGFVALGIARVGVGAFCRVTSPKPSPGEK